jgi:hypothetical protein
MFRSLFRSSSGSSRFLVKVTEFKNHWFKIFLKGQLWWCGSITFGACAWRSVWGGMLDCLQSNIPPHTEHHAHTPNVTLPHHHNWPFKKNLNSVIFKFSDFNKEPTSSLKMIWIMIETCWGVFKCFNISILDYYIIVYRSALVGV